MYAAVISFLVPPAILQLKDKGLLAGRGDHLSLFLPVDHFIIAHHIGMVIDDHIVYTVAVFILAAYFYRVALYLIFELVGSYIEGWFCLLPWKSYSRDKAFVYWLWG